MMALQDVPSTDAAIIYTMEPVAGGLVAPYFSCFGLSFWQKQARPALCGVNAFLMLALIMFHIR